MARYILRRLLRSLVTLLIVFTAVFMLLRFMPLNGYFPQEMIKETDEATRMSYLRNLGLLDHPFVQLGRFIGNLFHGDLGRSITVYPKVPISTLLAEKIPVTAFLGFWSMLLGIVAGISMGMMMVRWKNSLGDGIGNTYILLVRAVPSLIYLFFLQIWVSRWLRLPLVYDKELPQSWILPIICLSLSSVAWYALWVRRFMVDEENQDYVRFATVKGLSRKAVLRKHIFRVAVIPITAYLPSDLLNIVAGSLIIETLYAIPGTGGLLTTAIKRQDNNLVQVLVLMYAALSILGVFLGDLLLAFVDPRIRLTEDK